MIKNIFFTMNHFINVSLTIVSSTVSDIGAKQTN